METLETFILNTKKKFLTFSYKKKNITLKNSIWKSDPITSEDLKNISKIITEDSQKSITKMQKDFDKVAMDKEEDISHLRDHKLMFYAMKSWPWAMSHINMFALARQSLAQMVS